MRPADRLFRIIQILRRRRRPTTAQEIAEELETSLRTVYRDIAQLMAERVPIRGEAGMGYVLEGGFDMPPLMLTPDEIEAAMLGAQWVMTRADSVLARAATDLVAKIGLVYRDEKQAETRRLVWPIGVSYWDAVRLIVAWCEMRKGFRHFRTDRVVMAEFLEARYPTPRPKLRAQWKKEM